jgi:hypothetical protein
MILDQDVRRRGASVLRPRARVSSLLIRSASDAALTCRATGTASICRLLTRVGLRLAGQRGHAPSSASASHDVQLQRKHRHSVTCSTSECRQLFNDAAIVTICTEQILRTCAERSFRVIAYAFMKDHLHPQVLSAIDVKPGIDVVKAGKGAVYMATDGTRGSPCRSI